MKLVYISPLRYPSNRAGPLFSMKSCEAFAESDVHVELWVPWRREVPKNINLFEYFGVKANFKVRYFRTLDLTGFSDKFYLLLYLSFAVSVFLESLRLTLRSKINEYVFYSHEQFAIFLLTFVSKKTFYEVHDFPGDQKIYRMLFRRIVGVVTTNRWKATELSKRFHLVERNVLSVPNAVDTEHFSGDFSKSESRKSLSLPEDKYIVGYVGTLKTMGMEKGLSVALDSLTLLPERYVLYIIGGDSPQDIEEYKNLISKQGLSERVFFAGQVPHALVPLYISACDVLIAPFPKNDHYSYYMSPMKVFEYMASKRPIIASDLPTLREILEEGKTAFFVPPSDGEALAKAIEKSSSNVDDAYKMAESAYTEVTEKYTWQKRAEKILTFVKGI